MEGSCEGGSCTTQASRCSVTGHESCCPVTGVGAGCGCSDPFANAADVWLQDTLTAMREVKLAILRAKIQKELGPQLEKAADATWAAGGAIWQALLAQSQAAQAKEELREQLRKVFSAKGK